MIFRYFRFRIFLDEKIQQSYYLKNACYFLSEIEQICFSMFGKTKDYNPECYKILEDAFDVLNKFLDG